MITKKYLIKQLGITQNLIKVCSKLPLHETKQNLDTCNLISKLVKDAYVFDLGDIDDIMEDVDKAQEIAPKERRIPFPIVLLKCAIEDNPDENNQAAPPKNYLVTLLVELKTLAKLNKSFSKYAEDYSFGIFNITPTNVTDAGYLTWYIPSFSHVLVPYDPEVPLEANASITDEMFKCTKEISVALTIYFLNLLTCKNIEVRTKEEKPSSKLLKKDKILERTSDIIIKLPGKGVVYENETIKEVKFNERSKIGAVGQKRGHFKTFTEERPLFGKHVGTWWWSPVFQSKKRNYKVEITKGE